MKKKTGHLAMKRGSFSRHGFAVIKRKFAFGGVKPEELVKAFNYYHNVVASGVYLSIGEVAMEIRRNVFNDPGMGMCVNDWVRFFRDNYDELRNKFV